MTRMKARWAKVHNLRHLLAVIGLSIPVFFVLVALLSTPSAGVAIIATTLVAIGLLIDYRRRVGFFSPLLPLFLAVLTTLTVPAWLGYFDKAGSFGASSESNFQATAYFATFVVVSVAVYTISSSDGEKRVGNSDSTSWSPGRSLFVWLGTVCLALISLVQLMTFAGGPSAYLNGLSNRTVALAGQGVYIWLLLTPAGACLAFLAAHWSRRRMMYKTDPRPAGGLLIPLIPVLVSAFFLLATGNRMNLVVFVAAVAYTRHRVWNPMKLRVIAVGVIVVLFLGLALPSVIRTTGSASERQLSVVTLQTQYADFGPINTFGQIPALALAIDYPVERSFGTTYVAAITMFIPRSIAPWKLPDVGESVTKQVLPYFWYRAGTGVQVGAPGEAFVNFGPLGVMIVGLLAGAAMSALRKLGRSSDPRHILVYAILLPRTALYLRGGFATVTTYVVMDLLILAVAIGLSGFRTIEPSTIISKTRTPQQNGRDRPSWQLPSRGAETPKTRTPALSRSLGHRTPR